MGEIIKEKLHCSQAQVRNISTADVQAGAVVTGKVGIT